MSWFKERDVEDQVDRVKGVGKPESVGLTAELTDDLVWAEVLLG